MGEEVKLTAAQWEASGKARKKLAELEARRQKAVQTAVEGRHRYYDKLRDALVAGLSEELQAILAPEIAATETVEELTADEVVEDTTEA
jgi:hypothetical protein